MDILKTVKNSFKKLHFKNLKNSIYFRCNKALKVWPKKLGSKVFKCQVGIECDPIKLQTPQTENATMYTEKKPDPVDKIRHFVDVENTGESRLVCFEDGIDVCKPCATEHWGPISHRTTTTTTGY